ncbi:hypothetical protein HCG49_16895 [Arenibacter sp. 6A1]|uniref:hypothetical protein n=1 Tax=Arenibacter sp. 6A1 TaxID=2720391 RepID=UPI001445E493|nr:hypothetical protein [Arenibacter sp. 6A1]NKI28233.1 hypothetical protein [Arenibacter sp. 6A1]
MSINNKIIQYLDFKGISQRQFTSKCKLSEGVLRRGKNIGSGYLKTIKTNYPDFNINWLLFDEGEMIIKPSMPLMQEPQSEQKVANCINCKNLERLLESKEELLRSKDETISALNKLLGTDNGGKSKAS